MEDKGQYVQLERRQLQKQHNIIYYLKHMNNDYNQEKHYQLLKYSEDLRKQGKFIGKESREDYLKLLSYSAMVYIQLNWEIQGEYLKIFKEFLSNIIYFGSFVSSCLTNRFDL